ncbi:MAG TPA: folylpolyglutamate synthase/dihydrofolate synthase family protein [Thermotogota bacterium]|nr:bifunctional folylpolyglutamate synthase/dihydrofolate synthase [Thermotogota bacterium]HNR63088.1 folylpolyglutamate synthase/dihydrofolate synthase family protein [Thermotogota bacterium]HNT95238.1 folylpolyglutamate synthase/dihydrofolate synthase family protein [Thermotogota bacterium]HPB87404.1 folylpolyglutamate synthase/dihydrofolate synthase family protein [Thermotogota bacterium]HQC37948.1 folylpolyglutamate synthase/dihydrofolate synthase family protein [Thermotogota bacterium]
MEPVFKTMDEFYEFLYESRPHQQIKLGLERIFCLSRRLGYPEKSFRSIHIAGTNGKGSVTRMISSFLTAMGYTVGANYSPHLINFSERITLNDEPIPDKDCLRVLNAIYPAIAQMDQMDQKMKPSFFEIVTIMAFQYFMEEKVDFASIEVGMGGRLDASNILRPEVCAITSIGFDHMKSLGNTLAMIAGEKAGIIKKKVPVVCGAIRPEAAAAIRKRARLMESRAYFIGEDYSFYPKHCAIDDNRFDYFEPGYSLKDISLRLNGRHQFLNAATAICAYRRLCYRTGVLYQEETVRSVLRKVTWPGRFERIATAPDIVIDGGHNPPAFETLVKAWREYYGDQKAIFVTGILADKDYPRMIEIIAPILSHVIVTEPKAGERVQIEEVAEAFRERVGGVQTELIKDHREACRRALALSGKEKPILSAGSLYLVGYIKERFLECLIPASDSKVSH